MAVYLFDLDGTILLSGGAGARALNRAFSREYGISEGMEHIFPAGMTDPKIVEEMLQVHFGRSPRDGEITRVLEHYLSYLPQEISVSERFRIMPGIPAIFDRLAARGATMGLATGNLREGARHKLSHANLWHRFSFGGFADDSDDRPTLVRIASERSPVKAEPNNIYVVGDTPRDVAAAHACGFVCIAVATGPHKADELHAAGADRVIETLDELE